MGSSRGSVAIARKTRDGTPQFERARARLTLERFARNLAAVYTPLVKAKP